MSPAPKVLVDVVLCVIDVELAGRGHKALVLDDLFQLARLVVDNNNRRCLGFAVPDREPDFRASLVVFRLNNTLGALTQFRPLGDRKDFRALGQVVDIKDADRLIDFFI